MAQQEFTQEESIFHAALARPASEREQFLSEACGGDARLRERVLRLMQHDTARLSLSERRANLAAPRRGSDTVIAGETKMIGPFRLIRLIGEGGFGSVYLAEQTAPVRRNVALKIIKLGMDTKHVIARFEAERQALALMDHPAIAKVIDAGATQAGRPYFVMEHVDGVPITSFCDAHEMTTRARLELFVQVCRAVQHAHQKGIIHRDLKPSNILVTTTDGQPTPVIIDFGIAKATRCRLTERTLWTEQQQLIGTPAYMSPEQARSSTDDIDTRSDIYSLGVVLYEMLTGTTPISQEQMCGATLVELERLIAEHDPPRPSTRLSGMGDALEAVARRRRTTPHTLGRMVRGDLDWIIMKALEKERSRRYATANDVAMDIVRHLEDEPVLAGPPSRVYVASKFVKRHRIGVAAATVVLLTMVTGAAATTWQAVRATRAESSAVVMAGMERTARSDAERQYKIASAINEFLNEDLLAQASPDQSGRDVTVREVLGKALASLDEGGRFPDEPLVEASVRYTLGKTYLRLGDFDAAEAQLDRAIATRTRMLGPRDLATIEARYTLANLYLELGRTDEAREIYEEAHAVRAAELGEDSPAALSLLIALGVVHDSQSRFEDAERVYVRALDGYERAELMDDEAAMTLLNNLGSLYWKMGRWDDAVTYMRRAFEARKRVLGPENALTLVSQASLGALTLNTDGLDVAEQYVNDEGLAVRRRVLGEAHPDVLEYLHNLSALRRRRGRLDEAERYQRAALAGETELRGRFHPYTLGAAAGLAGILVEQGKPEPALELLAPIVEPAQGKVSSDQWVIADLLAMRGNAYAALGRDDEARADYRDALAIAETTFGPDHAYVQRAQERLEAHEQRRAQVESVP